MDPAFAQFDEAVNPLLQAWKGMDIRVIAQREKQGGWIFNSMRAELQTKTKPEKIGEEPPKVDGLFVARDVWAIGRFEEFVDSLSTGILKIGGEEVHMGGFDGQRFKVDSAQFNSWDRSKSRAEVGVDFTTFCLRLWSNLPSKTQETPETIDMRLRDCDPPWDGLPDLRQNYLSFSKDWSHRSDAAIGDIVAPMRLRVNEANLEGNSVDFRILNDFGGVLAARVGFVADLVGGDRVRKGIPVPSDKLDFGARVEFRDEPSHVSLFLTLPGLVVDRVDLFGRASPFANPRLALWQIAEGSVEKLKEEILQAHGRDLEKSIGLLFHLLGFLVQRFVNNEEDMPDLVALPTKGEWLLAIECTTDTIGINNKIVKLSARTKKLAAGHGFKVVPVLITSLDRKMVIQSDLERAGTEIISVLTMEGISRLLQMTVEGTANERVLDFIIRNISSTGIPGPSPLFR